MTNETTYEMIQFRLKMWMFWLNSSLTFQIHWRSLAWLCCLFN